MSLAPAVPSPQDVFRLIYRSRNLMPPERLKVGLGALFSKARSNNSERQITGALLVVEDRFVQALEGEEAAVRSLYAVIENDARHEDVTLVEAGPVLGRVFSRWAMAKVSVDGEPDIPLLSNKNGITVAADRRTTPDQDALLQTMRDAAREPLPAS